MTLYILSPALTTIIPVGGESVQIANAAMGIVGGVIVNPLLPEDQGIFPAEELWVNLIGPAGLATGVPTGTTRLLPGQSYLTPPLTNVWVNANSTGHQFTAFFSSTYEAEEAQLVPGIPGAEALGVPIYPPSGPTGLLRTIGGYLYQEYTDDDDLQGFVDAQTSMQQDYVDTFNALNLPIYPGPVVQGKLLDWVAKGLYGMSRPALSSGIRWGQGPLNTYGCNFLVPLNEIKNYTQFDTVVTDDDTYRRILTWHFYKGDGKYFDARWLKRRIWRFLFGVDGTSPETAVWQGRSYSIADTRQISVSIGADRHVMIEFILGKRTTTGGAILNEHGCNGFGPPSFPTVNTIFHPIPLNDVESTIIQYPPLPFMSVFEEAVNSGALELPYQFQYKVGIVTVR